MDVIRENSAHGDVAQSEGELDAFPTSQAVSALTSPLLLGPLADSLRSHDDNLEPAGTC